MGYKFGYSEFSCGSLSEFLLYLAFFKLWYAQINWVISLGNSFYVYSILDDFCDELFGRVVGINLIDAPVLHPVRLVYQVNLVFTGN